MIVIFIFIILSDEAAIFEIEDGKDLEVILRDIEYLKQNPVDINFASFEQLSTIPYLTITDCLKIVEYRKKIGSYSSLEDLLNISGFDAILLDRIRPYITIRVKVFKIEKFKTRMRLKTEIPKSLSSEEYYTKTELFTKEYNMFLVTEKDPYETSFFDYYASGILLSGGTRKFVLGKYNLDLGSGIMLSPIGSFFHSIDFRMMVRERGILPYTSVLENNGFFGAALADSLFLKFALFYSNQKLDGRIDSLGFARSFDESGEHTDSLAISRKDRINEEIFGYDIKYRLSDVLLSNRSYWCTYDPPFVCTDSFAKFYGTKFWMSGLELKYFGDVFVMFSELARSYENRIGGLFGFSGFFPYVDFNLAAKYFPAGFYSPKGIEARNDYVGGVIDIGSRSKIGNFATTLTIDNKAEEDSMKYSLRLNFEKKIGFVRAKFQIRWRYTSQVINLSGSRVFLRIRPLKRIFFDIRLEEKYIYDSGQIEKGIFGALEAGLEFDRLRLRIRYGLFETDSYTSRIFVYETDLPGIVNNRMLYNKGNYGFISLSIKPADLLKIGFKYSIVNKDSISVKQLGAQVDITL